MACRLELLGDTGAALHIALRPVVAPLSEPRIASLFTHQSGVLSEKVSHAAASYRFEPSHYRTLQPRHNLH